MRRALAGASLTVALALLAPLTAAAVDLSGSLSGAMTAGAYRIVDDIYVPSGQTLVLESGVIFEFEDSSLEECEFNVEGTLLAEGTSGTPIIFRATDGTSEFSYIRISSSSTIMRHCLVENAGNASRVNAGGLWIDNCSPLVEDCEVRGGEWHGIYVTGSSALPTIRRTVSCDNAKGGIVADSGAGIFLENCTVARNGDDGICLASGSNTIVGCLVWGNGEDGIDCNGVESYDAAIVNCTVGPHPAEGLSDGSSYRLYNTLVVDANSGVATAEHSLVMDDLSFFRFSDPAAGDFHLSLTSPAVNYGTRFGLTAALLPVTDLDGSARIHGIVDAGAYESPFDVRPGTERDHFSENLLLPRLGQPVLCEDGETFTILIGLMGTYSIGDISAELASPESDVVALTVSAVRRHVLTPTSDFGVMLYEPGLEEVQEITVGVPVGTSADLYDIAVDVSTYHYESESAVRIYDDYPTSWGVLHVTDPHIGCAPEDYTAAERLGFLVEEANFLNPEIVLVTGDICENQNLGHDWPQQFLDVIAGLKMPVYVIPGNHDYCNDGGSYNPAGWMRYFHEINRFENSVVRLGNARFYGLDTRWDHGTLQLYRCDGPTTEALDWAEADIATLGPSDKPRFWLMHGPNYDKFTWNVNNVDRVRDIMSTYDFALGLAGHTHRFETFRNSGTNYFSRNDFTNSDDWERDVAFPGYPLHTQTSSIGKDESITWRWIQIDGTEITFFTADTDGDGYRNTEEGWPLGRIHLMIDAQPNGVIISSVENLHYERWTDVRHYVPADAGTGYVVDGGTLVRRLPDGTAVVAVKVVRPYATSVITLTPIGTGNEKPEAVLTLRLHPGSPNPFKGTTRVRYRLPQQSRVSLRVYSSSGRLVRVLVNATAQTAGSHEIVWDGRDDSANELPSGAYFCRLDVAGVSLERKMVLLR